MLLLFKTGTYEVDKSGCQDLNAPRVDIIRARFLLSSTGFVLGCDVAHLVEVLRYMPEGRVFDLPWCQWDFSLT